jgi:hypothetical protein
VTEWQLTAILLFINRMKRGIKTIIAGVVILIFGAFVVPLLFIFPLFFGKSNEVQFKVPGTFEANVEKPGRYYLWNDFQTIFDGKSYNRSESIPDGMQITIRNSSGTELHLVTDTSISSNSGGSSQKSIGYVEIASPGKLEIVVTGGDERILSFAPSNLLKILGLILGAVGLTALVAIGGVGIGIWGIVKFLRSK